MQGNSFIIKKKKQTPGRPNKKFYGLHPFQSLPVRNLCWKGKKKKDHSFNINVSDKRAVVLLMGTSIFFRSWSLLAAAPGSVRAVEGTPVHFLQ